MGSILKPTTISASVIGHPDSGSSTIYYADLVPSDTSGLQGVFIQQPRIVDVNGKYYGTFGILHGCVIVKNGMKNQDKNPLDIAFVSPINGKVYKDWESCKTGQ